MTDDLERLDERMAKIRPLFLKAMAYLEQRRRRGEGFWYAGLPEFFHVPEDDQNSRN